MGLKGIVGPDGTTYHFDHEYLDNNPPIPEIDATLSVEGAAAGSKETGVAIEAARSDFGLNNYDVMRRFCVYNDRDHGGVVYTWNADRTVCHAEGTATTTSATNLYYDETHLPAEIVAGGKYLIKCVTTDANLLLEMRTYDDEGHYHTTFIAQDTEVYIPTDTLGLLLRIRTRNNTTVNATIAVSIPFTKTNKELADLIKYYSVSRYYTQIFPKYTVIGDSLSGGFMNRDGVSVNTETARQAGNNWVNYLALRIGRTFTNLATGGSTAKQWREELIDNANIDTDAYIIAIGVNDYRQELAVGSASDIKTNKANNADSFYGNYDYMVRQLMEWKSAAHVFCFTIPSIVGGQADDYNTAIRAITALYPAKVHCVDLRADYDDYLTLDVITDNYAGKHFNPVSYNFMSSVFEKALNDYIETNNELFAVTPYA